MKKKLILLLANSDHKKEIASIINKQKYASALERDHYLTRSVLCYHKDTFLKYKNIFTGKNIVVCGSGPTLAKYKRINDAIHIGTNKVHKKIKLDFLFRQDFKGYDQEIFSSDVVKFIGNYYDWEFDMCPESVFNRLKNAQKFIIDNRENYRIPVDLISQPLWHGGSVIFSAFQFALWTNPKRIYLVGCDCAGQVDDYHWNHFDDSHSDIKNHNLKPITPLIDGWKKISEFQKSIYPDVEIISINPVGLKGLFNDVYIT